MISKDKVDVILLVLIVNKSNEKSMALSEITPYLLCSALYCPQKEPEWNSKSSIPDMSTIFS